MTKHVFEKQVFKMVAIIVALAVGLRITSGVLAVGLVAMGVIWGVQGKVGKALCCYVSLPYFVIFSGYIIPLTAPMIASARLGVLAIGFSMMIAATKRRGNYTVPLAMIFLYVLCAAISSANGYCPNVSYLKLVNFAVFVAGLYIGCRNLDQKPQDLLVLRNYFLGLCFVMAVGSLCVLPFPAIAYSTSSTYLVAEHGVDAASEIMKMRGTEEALFSGLTSHSQTLAPESAMIIVFLLADMFFVERRVTVLHGFVLVCAFACLFLTRSRTGLLAISIGIMILCMYTVRKVRIPYRLKRRVGKIIALFFVGVVALAVTSEIRNKTMTKWLRKGDDLDTDKSIMESVTASRMGAVEELLADYRQSPMWGMGFQVNEMSARFKGQFVLSAPVEKGLLPMVIIGEGGIIGVITFLMFLVAFFWGCARQKMHVTALTFATFLATNLGEATFFSPGAVGGILWVFGIVGGVTLDSFTRAQTRMEMANVGWRQAY